jgi:hypothetical protein
MPLCRTCHGLVHDLGTAEFYRRTGVDVVAEVRHFEMVAAGDAAVHSGRCTSSSLCNACWQAAESAWERTVDRG